MSITVTAPEIKTFEAMKIMNEVECHRSLGAVKSLPEFNVAQEQYKR